MFSELSGYVGWCLTLIWGKFLVIIISNIPSVPFSLSLSSSPITCMLHLLLSSQSLEILFWVLFVCFVFVLPIFQFWRFVLRYSQAKRFFPQRVQSANKLIKSILNFCYSAFSCSVSFWFFPRIYISLLNCCFVLACCLLIGVLSILILGF